MGARATVIVLDDDDFIRRAIGMVCDRIDLDLVAEAATVEEAIDAAARHRPDIAVVDGVLQGTSGLSAIADIRAVAPACQVVVFSGTPSHDEARRAGAAAMVVKQGLGEITDTLDRLAATSPTTAP